MTLFSVHLLILTAHVLKLTFNVASLNGPGGGGGRVAMITCRAGKLCSVGRLMPDPKRKNPGNEAGAIPETSTDSVIQCPLVFKWMGA